MTKYVENVNAYLSQMKIKQNYISKKSGIDTKKLSRILTGKQDATGNDMTAIAAALGKNVEFYLEILSKASERLSTKFEPRYLVRTSSSAARASGVPLWRMLPS